MESQTLKKDNMPFKSNKQKKYFFAKLNSLPKGSEQYNKWKKVVDKFVAHSVDESYELDEARSNPEVNVDQPVAKQIEQFVEKHKGAYLQMGRHNYINAII